MQEDIKDENSETMMDDYDFEKADYNEDDLLDRYEFMRLVRPQYNNGKFIHLTEEFTNFRRFNGYCRRQNGHEQDSDWIDTVHLDVFDCS